jgi:CheY-like chemotaxis protein
MNILVVDDDERIGRLLDAALGVEETVDDIRVVRCGSDALAECLEFTPDLIILDYWMPQMDGAEAAGKIRKLCPRARIVAFSGSLEGKPDWADAFYPKGDLPDIERIIDLR